jgi:hypothetical protein
LRFSQNTCSLQQCFFFVALRTCFIGWLFLIGLVFSVAWLG